MYIHNGWIVMEIATILCGLFYFYLAPFPFLMFPVAFCIWLLSMDICPLVRGWPLDAFVIRQRVSLVISLLTMASAFLLERSMGANPDYAYWLYLFGLLTFWTALTLSPQSDEFGAALYLLINICLGIVGSHLDRTTFRVFSTLGVIGYNSTCLYSRMKWKWFAQWILKAFAAAALFAQAIKTGGNFEIVEGLFCVLMFNYSSILVLASSEFYYILVVATNLGFVAAANAFQRPIYLWFFTIDDQYLDIVGLLCCITVAAYHGGLVWYAVPQNWLVCWGQHKEHMYHVYRVLASLLLSFCLALLGYPGLAWLGALGIPIAAFNYAVKLIYSSGAEKLSFHIVAILLLVLGIFFSNFLQSNILYLTCCFMLLVMMMRFQGYGRNNDGYKAVGCLLSVMLALLSVLIHSRFMITIATIYIFTYLSYLAYEVFRHSLFFPLVLVALGGAVIYGGVVYQRSEDMIQAAVVDRMPKVLSALLSESIYSDRGWPSWSASIAQSKFSWDSLQGAPANWILWSGALTYSLSKGTALYIPVLCGLGIFAEGLAVVVLNLKQRCTLQRWTQRWTLQRWTLQRWTQRWNVDLSRGIEVLCMGVVTVSGRRECVCNCPLFMFKGI